MTKKFTFRNGCVSRALAVSLCIFGAAELRSAEVIVDNADSTGVTITGAWTTSTNPGYWGTNTIHDGNTGQGTKSVRFTPNLPAAGNYEVYVWWNSNTNRATNVPIDVNFNGGTNVVTVNQQANGGQWNLLGTYSFAAGTAGNVRIANTGTNGYVFADAVKFVTPPPPIVEVIVDNAASSGVAVTGAWTTSTNPGFWGTNTIHDGNGGKGTKSVRFTPTLPTAGAYNVSVWWNSATNRATNVPIDVNFNGGSDLVTVNQQVGGGQWNSLGTYSFAAGIPGNVLMSNTGTNGFVFADAVKFTSVPITNAEVIVDNADSTGVTLTGAWTTSTNPGFWGTNTIHDGNTGKGTKSVRFTPNIQVTGSYDVYVWWNSATNRATNVPIDVNYNGGSDFVTVNQQVGGGQWNFLGTYPFVSGTEGSLLMSNTSTNGYVFADAVKFKPAAPAPSLFGVSMSASSRGSFTAWAPTVAGTGIRWIRGTQGINNVTPDPGVYNWVDQDALLNNGASYGVQFIGMIAYNADWINPNTQTFPTANLPGWSAYVTALVNHCKDRVRYWEVGNEPPNFTSNGTPQQYAQTMVAAYDAAKAADPACFVGLAAKSSDLNWLYQTINSGAADHFDFITLHPYEVLGSVAYGFEGQYMSIVPTVRKMLAAINPTKAHVPILFTEIGEPVGGVNGSVTVTPTSQAHTLVKAYAMGIAQGVAQIDWFEGRDGDSGAFGLMTSANVQRPAFVAMSKMIQHFGQNPQYLGWVLLNSQHYGFVFQGSAGTVMAAWAKPGTTSVINFGQTVQLVNPATGVTTSGSSYTLTPDTVLVLGVPSSLITQAQANKDLPFPWGGDFSGASSVSITMPGTEAGLHQYKADVTSTAVSSPYGAARYCDKIVNGVQKGTEQFFLVDPNYLSYTTQPIEVTVRVRRNAANDPATIQLNYEWTGRDYKSTTSYTIPGNTQWYDAVWTITDAQFVGNWAYNFRVSSGSPKYYIQSITVRKL